MQQKIGIVKNIKGQFKAVDKEGNTRILKSGDFIYEGDQVSSTHEQDGGLSDSVNSILPSGDFFLLIQDLRTSETYLIRQGGYRYFDIQDMGNDEISIGRQILSSTQTSDTPDDDHGTGVLSGNVLVGPQAFLSNPIYSGPPTGILPDEEPELQPELEPEPESEPDSDPKPELNHSPVFIGGDTTGSVTEIADNVPGENATIHTAGGTLNFTDSDTSDTHTVTAAPKVSGYLGHFNPTVDTVTGKIHWEFTVPDADIDHLKEGQSLTQTYTITVDDGNGGTTAKDVTVTIVGKNDTPDPQPDTGSVSETSPGTTGNVLVNDSDVDGDNLSVSEIDGNAAAVGNTVNTNYGSITVNADGSYTYTADTTHPSVSGLQAKETLTDTITYTVSDGNGGTATKTLTITISGANDAPSIGGGDTTGNVTEIADKDPGENITDLTARGTLNFTDLDNSDTHTVTAAPTAGSYLGEFSPTVDSATGKINWEFTVPDADIDHLKEGETLTQTYTITVDDGHGGTATQDVTVTIVGKNDAPDPLPDTGSVSETSPGTTGNVLVNDSDVDGDNLSVSEIDGNAAAVGNAVNTNYGSITVNADGSYTYTADTTHPSVSGLQAKETLNDTITYTVSDGNGGTATKTLTITISGANDAPSIGGGDTTGNVTEIADKDPGENITDLTARGTLNFTDLDNSDTHTVTAAPTAGSYLGEFSPTVDSATGKINWEFTVPDADIDHLKEGETLTQTYTITVDDGHGGTATQDVTVTIVGKNDAPDPLPDTGSVSETSPGTTGNVLVNDSDVDGENLSVSEIDGNAAAVGNAVNTDYGSITVNEDGSYTYTADTTHPSVSGLKESETLTDTITYTVSDGNGGTATETLTITINGSNNAPSIGDDNTTHDVTEIEDKATGENNTTHLVTGSLDLTDADTPLSELTISFTPLNGQNGYLGEFTPAIDSESGKVTWGFTVEDSDLDDLTEGKTIEQTYTITVNDGHGGTATKDVTIILHGKNEGPDANPDSFLGYENQPATGNVLDDDNDVDGNNSDLSVTEFTVNGIQYAVGVEYAILDNGTPTGKLTLNANGSYTFEPATDWHGEVPDITYTIKDVHGGTDTAILKISIVDNAAPLIDLDSDVGDGETGFSATYTEQGEAVSIADTDMDVVNGNQGTDQLENATITLTNTKDGDILDISNINNDLFKVDMRQNQGPDGDDTVITITAKGGQTPTLGDFETAIKSITFETPGDKPNTEDRIIEVKVSDGNSDSNTAISTIKVVAVDDPPLIDLNSAVTPGDNNTDFTTGYTEGDATSVSIAGQSMGVADADTPNLTSATITLTNTRDGDKLDTSGVDPTKFTVVTLPQVAGSEATVVLITRKTGVDADHAAFQEAIKAVTFSNTSEDPSDEDRIIEVKVSDGNSDSNVATTTIAVTPVNDPPTVNNVSVEIDKDAQSPVAITLTATDLDSPVSDFKLTSLPENGRLYMDEAMTQEVTANTGDIAATDNKLTLYFKPDYSAIDDSTPFGSDRYTPTVEDVTFNFVAKDSDTSDGVTYSDPATATITIDDVPVAAGESKIVTENVEGESSVTLTGNLLTNGTDLSDGKDYLGKDGAMVYQVRYTDDSGQNVTADVVSGDTGSTFDTEHGTLKVKQDGTYIYTPDGGIDHSANDGADVADNFSYTIKDGDGDVSNWADQNIAIADGNGPGIESKTASVNEANLPTGSAPDGPALTQTGTFDVTKGTDEFDVVFDSTQASLDGLSLTSGGTALVYTRSADGHTLTATKGTAGAEIFTVTITHPETESAGYEFVLKGPLDANGDQDDLELPFKMTVTDDDDRDSATATLTVTVVDDNTGDAKAITVVEDSNETHSVNTFTTNADANQANTHIGNDASTDGRWVNTDHGQARVNADGTVTYKPKANYSGEDTFTYTTTAEGTGSNKTVTVTATVNPVSDAPTMGEEVRVTTNEDTPVALNGDADWKLPAITDAGDQNGATEGDWPERMGLLELADVPNGAVISYGSNTYTSTGSAITIKIVDTTIPNYHTTEAQTETATLTMSKADFEQMQIKPPPNSSTNMALTLTATEYEVDGNGSVFKINGTDIPGETSTQQINVTVDAVTDSPFTLTKATTPTGKNEDSVISLKEAFTFARGEDTDGSEHYTMKFSSTTPDALDHVMFQFPGGNWETLDQFNAAGHDFTGDTLPDVKIKTLDHDSRDIKGLTLTLTPQDHDEDTDTAVAAGTAQSATLDDITIIPVANDVTLTSTGAIGNEDTRIPMGLTFENADRTGNTGQENLDHVVISGIPVGTTIYKGDGIVFTSTDTDQDFDTSEASLDQSDIESLTILPPQDFSGEIPLTIKVYSTDFDDDTPGGGEVETADADAVTYDYTITVNGVVDTSSPADGNPWTEGENEAADQGRLYVTINNNLTTDPDAAGFTVPEFNGTEDNSVSINGLSWKSYEPEQHPTSDGSETATFVIKNYGTDTTAFTLEDNSGKTIGKKVNGGWEVTEEQLATLHVKAQKDFSGTIHLQLETTVTDGTDENVQHDPFNVTFTPVTDEVRLQLTDVYATEDTKIKFDIYPQTSDVDGSEEITKVELTNIPNGVTLYIKDGQNYTEVNYGNDGSHTFTIDDTEPYAAGTITTDQLKNIYIQAPPESNAQFTVDVKPYVKDPGGGDERTLDDGQPQTVNVYVKGDADTPVRKDGTSDKITKTGDEPQPNDQVADNLVNISDLGFQSGENPADGSETLTYILHDLPKAFSPTNAAGESIGSFIATNADGEVTWSFTQAEMDVLHIKVPDYYSGTVANLKLEAIAVENDGDTATASRTFDLIINPVVSTTDPVDPQTYTIKEPVTQHTDSTGGADDQTTNDTFVPLVFTNTVDGETVTQVEVDSVPDGVMLGIQNGENVTPVTPDASGKYTFTSDIEKIVAIIKGDGDGTTNAQTHANDDHTLIISGIRVTVADAKDDDPGEVKTNLITAGDITLTVEAQADQPDITELIVQNPSQTQQYYNNVTVVTAFPDNDGSESHYYIVTAPENVLLGEGVDQGGGNWYLTETDMADGFHAWFRGTATDTKNITITAYAAENTLAQDSITATIYGDNGTGPSDTIPVAQEPTLVVADPTPDEDTSFKLDTVISEAYLNDSDGGSETLSFVIKDIDLAAGHIESIKGASQYTYDDNGTPKIAYYIDAARLNDIVITPEANYSGPINFTLEAVANEPTAPVGHQVAITSKPVTVTVQPVTEAELIVTPEGELATAVDENSITKVTLALSNGDESDPETFSNINLKLAENQGTFVDNSGNNTLGDGKNLAGVTYDAATHTFTYGGQEVYYQPPEHEGGEFTIQVIATMQDGASASVTDSENVTVTVTPMPSNGAFTLENSDGQAVNTTDNKLVVNEDALVQLNIHPASFDDEDGSEFQTVIIKDVPPGMLFYADEQGNTLVGEINAVGANGTNIWKLPTSVMNGNLYIKPPLHYTQDITLTVEGVAMESENMGFQTNHEASFTLDITPVANGASIFPQTAQGEEDLPFKVDLNANFVAQEEIDSVGLSHQANETYNLTFKDAGKDITLYYKEGTQYHTLDNTDNSGTNYVATSVTQAQIDNLYVRVHDSQTGGFSFPVEVSTTDGSSTSAITGGTLNMVVSSADGGTTMTIDGQNTIFGQSGDDTITGTAGEDVIYGGIGDDTIVFDPKDAVIDGGDGEDTLEVSSNQNFTQFSADLIVDMEVIDLTGNGRQTINLDVDHVKAMTDADDTLLIRGDTTEGSKDTVNLDSDWADADPSTQVIDNITYHILDNNGAHLKIEDGVNYTIA